MFVGPAVVTPVERRLLGTGGASCIRLSSRVGGGSAILGGACVAAVEGLLPLTDLEGLKELELPILFRGAIAAETDGLGLCEYGAGSVRGFGVGCSGIVGLLSSFGLSKPKSKLLFCGIAGLLSGVCKAGLFLPENDGTEGTSGVSQSNLEAPEIVDIDLLRV